MNPTLARISIGDQGVLNEAVDLDLSAIWVDRDLGWLDFNERVLAEALDARTPLLERVKFLAIFSSNLDEFYMKRIAVLREKQTPERIELLKAIREKLLPRYVVRPIAFAVSSCPDWRPTESCSPPGTS